MLWRRVRIYLFGLGLGCLLVYFFLIRGKGRDFGFWLPENRIWEEISRKAIDYSDKGKCERSCYGLTEEQVRTSLLKAHVDFDRSLPREKPRKYFLQDERYTYWIDIDKNMVRVQSIVSLANKQVCACNI